MTNMNSTVRVTRRTAYRPLGYRPVGIVLQLCLAVLVVGGCASEPRSVATAAVQRELQLLVSFFAGTFESIPQPPGEGDSSKVTLRHVPIWPGGTQEHWFYVEYQRPEAAAPFRERIYRFREEPGGRIVATPYELPGPPHRFAGEWRKPVPFAALGPRDLRERRECGILFLRQGEIPAFNAGTEDKSCRGEEGPEEPEYFVSSSSIRHRIGAGLPWEFRKIDQKIR